MLKNYVEETANSPGSSSTITLGGAPAGRLTWRGAGFTNGASVFYFIDDGSLTEWGVGTLTLGASDTLTRTIVLGNSSGTTTRLNFPGTCRVYNALPAERQFYIGASGVLSITGDLTIGKASPQIVLDRTAAGQFAGILGRVAGSNRWAIFLGNSTAESTGDVGSDFTIRRYNNSGALLDSPVTITRSDGSVLFQTQPRVRLNSVNYGVWHAGNFDPNSKQAALGFTPIQQGGGVGQLGNTVRIGWSGSRLKASVDTSDLGNLVFDGQLGSALANYLPLSGGLMSGNIITVSDEIRVGNGEASDKRLRLNNSTRDVFFGLDLGGTCFLYDRNDGVNGYTRWTTDTAGNFVARGNVTAFSDRRLKRDIAPIGNALEKVLSLCGVEFTSEVTGQRGVGLIAQDVQAVFPEAVVEAEGSLGVAYGNLVGPLVEAVRTLSARVDDLTRQIAEQKGTRDARLDH